MQNRLHLSVHVNHTACLDEANQSLQSSGYQRPSPCPPAQDLGMNMLMRERRVSSCIFLLCLPLPSLALALFSLAIVIFGETCLRILIQMSRLFNIPIEVSYSRSQQLDKIAERWIGFFLIVFPNSIGSPLSIFVEAGLELYQFSRQLSREVTYRELSSRCCTLEAFSSPSPLPPSRRAIFIRAPRDGEKL